MPTHHPDQVVNAFLTGALTRRQLIARLMALGAASAGASRALHAAIQQPSGSAGAANAHTAASAAGALQPAAQAGGPTFQARSVDHIALAVTDIPRSRDWYVKHLGLRVTSESRDSCFLDCGDDFVALFRSQQPGLHHYSYAIPNYNQADAARRLREAGLTPKPRGGRMYFDDPDGIEVQVSQA